MKRFLTAFTLAEILVTLAIVGVIARVTLPSLMSNVTAQETTTTLAKAINTLEIGNQKIITTTGAKTIKGGSNVANFSASNYISQMENYLNGSVSTKTVILDGESKANQTVFLAKDAIMYTPLPYKLDLEPESDRTFPSKYHGKFVGVIIDVNGISKPNMFGRDQFVVYVDYYGSVIPYGGTELCKYRGDSSMNSLSLQSSNSSSGVATGGATPVQTNNLDTSKAAELKGSGYWPSNCSNTNAPKSGTDGRNSRAACTGSIIDNGYKIIYKQ